MRTIAHRAPALAALIVLVLAASAHAIPQSGIVRPTTEPPQASLQLGAQLFAGNCASCHGIAGSGISHPRPGAGNVLGAGPPLHGVGAQAADFYLSTGYMPLSNIHAQPESSRVLFSDKEIQSLTRYVASLGSGPAIPHPSPANGSVHEGFDLFDIHCAGCHQIDARGGYVTGARVPPLQGVTGTQIAEAVRIGPYEMPRFGPRQISDTELSSLVRYVLSTDHIANRGGWGIGNLGPIPEGLVVWWIAIPLILIACTFVGRRMRRS